MTYWTQSGPGEQHGSTALIAVDEIIKDAAGAEVLKTKAELGEIGEGAQAFIFKVRLLNNLHDLKLFLGGHRLGSSCSLALIVSGFPFTPPLQLPSMQHTDMLCHAKSCSQCACSDYAC